MSEDHKLAVTTNAAALSGAFGRYATLVTGKSIADVLREEMKGLAVLLLKLTPSRSRPQGEKALKRDIARSVRPLRPRSIKGSSHWAVEFRRNLREHNDAAVAALMRVSTTFRDAQLVPFTEDLHASAKQGRGTVAKWTGKVTMDVEAFDAYVEKMLPRVGNARGGWVAAVRNFGGNIAAWVSRHSYAGSFRDNLGNPLLGFIEATNASSWAKAGLSDRIVANALRTRTGVIERKIERAEANARQEAFA
jgi:hypothetical protein